MLIDPQGLLYGERIGACSDEAQLHFPRLLTASNRMGRLELSYRSLVQLVYASMRTPPTPEQVRTLLLEYRANFLLFIYKGPDGTTYGQWEIPEKYLTEYKRAEDHRIPAPPLDALQAFRNSYVEAKRARCAVGDELFNSLEVSETLSEGFGESPTPRKPSSTVQLGEGKGRGIGKGKDKDACDAASAPPAVIGLPLVSGELHLVTQARLAELTQSFPALDVMQHLRAMREWLMVNPRNRKTASGIQRFVVSWLTREQNSARRDLSAAPPRPGARVGMAAAPGVDETKKLLAEQDDAAVNYWREMRSRGSPRFAAECPGWVKQRLQAEQPPEAEVA